MSRTPQTHPLASSKSGISLIAVLMFMLAATTASIVIFRMISSENFSSGARLKASEAYQASESGIDAVRSWITNRSADASALVTQYLLDPGKRAIHIDHLGKVVGGEQEFDAYLIGVDTTSGSMGLKILVEGRGRDGSKVNQVAIIGISGLSRIGDFRLPGSEWDGGGGGGGKPNLPNSYGSAAGTQGYLGSGRLQLDCDKYCENKTGFNSDADNTGGAVLIGDFGGRQGFSTSGDAVITGSFNGDEISGMKVGCPVKPGTTNNPPSKDDLVDPANNPRPPNYATMVDAAEVGNFYVKENFSGGTIGMCGSVYIGGDMNVNGKITIWGDLYVEGNLNLNQELKVYGNLTVKGNTNIQTSNPIKVDGNFVLPSLNSSHTRNQNNPIINVDGTVCRTGNNAPFTNKPSVPQSINCSGVKGGDILDYIGRNITPDGNGGYTIPEPIKMGSPNVWKSSVIPANCDARLWNPSAPGTWVNSSGIIEFNTSINSNVFMNAINACISPPKEGNWSAADETKWLVLRVNWSTINNFENETFDGNFIIIVENLPTAPGINLPRTTKESNVLLWLAQKSNTSVEIKMGYIPSGTNYARNYFIYSETNVKLNGTQSLKGSLFMAGGAQSTMEDTRIDVNKELLEALGSAGVITNKERCSCDNEPPPDPILPEEFKPDDTEPWVPVSSQLLVEFRSKEISKEKKPTNSVPIKRSILVIPRMVFLTPTLAETILGNNSELKHYYSYIYLNRAEKKDPEDLAFSCSRYKDIGADSYHRCICTSSARPDGASVSDFYVYVGDPSRVPGGGDGPQGPGPGNISSSAQQSSGSQSSNSQPPTTTTFTCNVNGDIALGSTTIPSANRTLPTACSNGQTLTNPSFVNINYTTPGSYSNIWALATCGTENSVSVECTGTINVVGLYCNSSINIYAKPNTAVIAASRPKPSCSNDNPTNPTPTWTRNGSAWNWTVPTGTAAGTVFNNITASANCGAVSNLTANCGSVTASEITCSNVPSFVKTGDNIPSPTLTCTGGTAAQGMNYTTGTGYLTSFPSTVPGTAVPGTTYNIGGTARCGTSAETHLASMAFTCSPISVEGLSSGTCAYQASWCNGSPATSGAVSTTVPPDGSNGNSCFFVRDISTMQAGPNSKINGVATTKNSGDQFVCSQWNFGTCASLLPAKQDGGYYIYTGDWVNTAANSTFITGSAQCGGGGGTSSAASSSSSAPSSSSSRVQTTNCSNFIGSLPASPNPPSNSYTACFKHTNNKCYVCKIANESGGNTCASSWLWTGGAVDDNLTSGYWYYEVTCPATSSSSVAPSSSSSGGGGCAYQASWCNGSPATSGAVSTTVPPDGSNGNTCFFVRDISTMQAGNNSKINGVAPTKNNNNNTEFVCGQWGLGTCASLLPAKQDGGYYIYTGDWISNNTFTTGSPQCGGGSPSSSSATPVVTCTFPKAGYKQGENIKPTVSCTGGTLNLSGATFNTTTGSLPNDYINWKNNQNAYYPVGITGSQTITVSNACGSALTATCTPTLNITQPTCSISGTYNTNTNVAPPTIDCGGTVSSNTFSITNPTGTITNWSNNQQFGNPGNPNPRAVTMTSVTCNDRQLNYSPGISCGSINIVAPATWTLSCGAVPSTGTAGTAITPPTVTCSDGSTNTPVTTNLTWINAPNWGSPAAGTYNNITVTTNNGNCNGKPAANCSGSLTVGSGGGGNTYTLNTAYQQLASGTVTINCSSQMGMECYANPVPAANVDLGCSPGAHNPISIWNSTSTGPTYIGQCITSITCNIPSDKTIYCRKQ